VDTCDANGTCQSGTPVVCVGSGGCLGAPTCDSASGACSNPGGVGCIVFNASTLPGPGVGSSAANVADPSPDMELGCKRLRDIPVRFLHFTDDPNPSYIESVEYRQAVITEISESFARACLTFHE